MSSFTAGVVGVQRIPIRINTSNLRPSFSDENVSLNLGMDDEEVAHLYESRRGGCYGQSCANEDHVDFEGDFDCHICFETATDPCVTRCGHLFCWHDLRRWLRLHPVSPRCPVCKTPCSMERDVVPIFGRGKRPKFDMPSSVKMDAVPHLPSPPATPPPDAPPRPLPSLDAVLPAASTRAAAAQGVHSESEEHVREKHQPTILGPQRLFFLEQFLRHHFARMLSLLALAFFLSLLSLPRSSSA